MAETKMYEKCTWCNGTGTVTALNLAGEWVVTENPCTKCLGAGKVVVSPDIQLDPEVESKIDSLTIEISDIKDKVNDIKEKCDEIKEVCDNIWDKVK